jgi:ABC-type uncharacterized transport system permease subunit
MNTFSVVAAAALFASIGFNQLLALRQGRALPTAPTYIGLLIAALLGAFGIALTLYDGYALNLGVFTFIATTTLSAIIVILVTGLKHPTAGLGAVLSPITAMALLASLIPSGEALPTSDLSGAMIVHICFSVLAFSFLINASIQATLSSFLNRHLHQKKLTGLVTALPPLQTMETVLFNFLSLGVVALTVAIASGFMAYDDLLAQHLIHKTVLSVVAWLFFGSLLFGHLWKGWRGQIATRLTLIGFCFLTLGYIGSEFIVQYVLQT